MLESQRHPVSELYEEIHGIVGGVRICGPTDTLPVYPEEMYSGM
jgi:hypothetical protein